jgi:hypothetical protein
MKLTVLVVEPGKHPYTKEIDSGLAPLQSEVGGSIEAVYPYDDPVAIICNEEGKLMGLPKNRALADDEGHIYDILCGTFLVAGISGDDFASLPSELAEKYSERFWQPEAFAYCGDHFIVIRRNNGPH